MGFQAGCGKVDSNTFNVLMGFRKSKEQFWYLSKKQQQISMSKSFSAIIPSYNYIKKGQTQLNSRILLFKLKI